MLDDTPLTALRAIFGDRLSVTAAVLAEHAQSESLVSAGPPDAVVFPRTTDEVAALARWSTAHRIPLIGWGAGTSLEGHALALSGGVVVNFRDMAAVLEI
ncbi:MAG TPA: FAD-binding protein, partial [Tabrizicola sp.]